MGGKNDAACACVVALHASSHMALAADNWQPHVRWGSTKDHRYEICSAHHTCILFSDGYPLCLCAVMMVVGRELALAECPTPVDHGDTWRFLCLC
jgi:hypothetical protein